MTEPPFPQAAPGSQGGLTRAAALAMAAAMIAGGAFAAYGVRSATRPQAPNCPPGSGKSTDWAPDDLDGCWEQRGNQSFFRTTAGGHYYYHWEPPPTSRYYGQGGVGG